ncbi:ComEA family DNA-binding protein [Peptoniphilus equinus]|uniref:ComEA family DNA-binding protein n=1 Tax=Peptoniphilus equinus TaxID=3016343 RepID=A0ABY7QW59_9FIRM|nr:ComEA family DNA-binding protein [Peptoniphilus equinus]WBW50290.1 ComEA family DNA-binding protein [Peptoniphilus equinus]
MSFKNNKLLAAVMVVAMIFISKVLVDMNRTGYLTAAPSSLAEPIDDTSVDETAIPTESTTKEGESTAAEPSVIYVHISGYVKTPGLLKLPEGSRIIDGINAAGGALEGANLDAVNLAQKLQDEDHIIVPGPAAAVSNTHSGKVTLNTATKEELMTLNGIGDKTAESILEYRKQHPFSRPEDLLNVPGIGEKTFESLKDHIQ